MDRERLFAEIRAVYEELESDLAGLGGRCDRSGRCCRFREFGHRLYLTEPELLYMLDGVDLGALTVPEDRCPFLTLAADGRPTCGNHAQRAIGCRIFFCNASDPAPFHAVYEKHHARMKEIGERHGIDYRYREILAAIGEEKDSGATGGLPAGAEGRPGCSTAREPSAAPAKDSASRRSADV